MRGLFSARYLELIQKRLDIQDLGKCFDLIVGTSTGAILGCGLAKGIELNEIIKIYREQGTKIFKKKLPSNWRILFQKRKKVLEDGEKNLKAALNSVFESTTLADIYNDRQIALAITSINYETSKSWVFKTPHNIDTNHRDDDITLIDACMATSAAPIYRSLASVEIPQTGVKQIFVDGGLWANNPILVALTEALRVTDCSQKIEIFSLGTCSSPSGNLIDKDNRSWGLRKWKGGAKAVELAMDAQTYAIKEMARMMCEFIDRDIEIIRFDEPEIAADQTKFLSLDAVDVESCDFLEKKAFEAFDKTNQSLSNRDSSILTLKK